MEFIVVLLLLYLFLALVVFPIWALVKIGDLKGANVRLRAQFEELRDDFAALRKRIATPDKQAPPVPQELARPPATTAPTVAAPAILSNAEESSSRPTEPVEGRPYSAPETIPSIAVPLAAIPSETPAPSAEVSAPPVLPPVIERPVYTPPAPQPGWMDSINWEQFMGAKLFAWLGGLALFLGVAFFVKYSFDHGWIPPEARVALGFLFGTGLVIGGLRIDRVRYRITAQTLIATGIVSLYAVTFACNSVYHFPFFGTIPTFLLMTLITAAAFVLAVSLEAPVVALLGMLGGFLTPVLLSTGVDNPGGLFGYLALLDIGLIAVALRKRWNYLVPLGAAGTALMMLGWAGKFLTAEKGPVAMTVCLGFNALYLIANEFARRREASDRRHFLWTAVALPFTGFGFALAFLDYPALAANAPLYLGFVLLLDAALLRLAWIEETLPRLANVAGGAVFLLFSFWTGGHLTDASLPWALAFFLAFAALHSAFPLVLQRRWPERVTDNWAQLFPPLALVLMLLPIARLDSISFLIWPAILLVDVLAIGLAVLSASLMAVVAVLVLTLIATGLCIFRVPVAVPMDASLLFAIGGFALFFFGASLWLVRRLGDLLPASDGPKNRLLGDARAQLPAFSTLLPFLLLVMVCLRLNVPDPSMVFGLGLLLTLLTLGLARMLTLDWLGACALAGVAAVEYSWHGRHFDAHAPGVPLTWYLGFYAIFTVFPFVFRRQWQNATGPWATAALAGVVQFPLVYRAIQLGMPNDVMGLLPTAFAIPPLAGLALILKQVPASEPKRLNQLAWFGAAGLFFITLIFPVQFDRQWLTIGWALEGAALLWLFHRVPHAGLRLAGVALLVTAFVRLSLNGAILSYHVRGDVPVLNWYLYAYGLVTVALFAGARLLAPPRDQVLGVKAPALLNTLGVILAFFLLNLEIADFFTLPGARTLAFKFSGHFGRDMTYTIAWALFALGLLSAGIWRQARAARYAALALLGVALAKLFLHDLARLEALYRVGALFGVAVIAIVASFAYQRFLPAHEKAAPPAS